MFPWKPVYVNFQLHWSHSRMEVEEPILRERGGGGGGGGEGERERERERLSVVK